MEADEALSQLAALIRLLPRSSPQLRGLIQISISLASSGIITPISGYERRRRASVSRHRIVTQRERQVGWKKSGLEKNIFSVIRSAASDRAVATADRCYNS